MKNILFYISGHGYGHATRCIEIIKKLSTQSDSFFCHIKTNAPEWLFNLNLRHNFQIHYFFNDVGLIQQDWLTVDKKATLAACSELWQDKAMIVARELDFIEKSAIEIIVGDIPPIAFEIAAAAGIPGLALGNFCWDWIYRPYLQEYPEYSAVVTATQEAYGKGTLLLRLPFAGDMSAFKQIIDVPLVGRQAQLRVTDVRKSLPITLNPSEKLVLIALRKNDRARINLQNIQKIKNTHFLAFDKKLRQEANITWLPTDLMPFQELVNAVDLVVSKLGYGIVSECIINQTPLMFTDRYDFIEHDVLKQGLEKNGTAWYLPLNDYVAGNWEASLQQVWQASPHWPEIAVNGAEVVVSHIKRYLGREEE